MFLNRGSAIPKSTIPSSHRNERRPPPVQSAKQIGLPQPTVRGSFVCHTWGTFADSRASLPCVACVLRSWGRRSNHPVPPRLSRPSGRDHFRHLDRHPLRACRRFHVLVPRHSPPSTTCALAGDPAKVIATNRYASMHAPQTVHWSAPNHARSLHTAASPAPVCLLLLLSVIVFEAFSARRSSA